MAMMKQAPIHTGYMNVDIIGNEDLFPDEGYEFPPSKMHHSNRNAMTSTLFPLNSTINQEATLTVSKKIHNVPEPPKPFVDEPMRGVKSHRSRYIYNSTIKTRAAQIKYNQELKEYRMNVGDPDMEIEEEQRRLAIEAERRNEEALLQRKKELAETYNEQLAAVKRRQEKEREEQRKYEAHLAEMEKQARLEDEEKAKKQAQIREERRLEFQRKNEEIKMNKLTKHQREKEEEKRLQQEAAELDEKREARKLEDERRRLEMTRIRAGVVDRQAKALLAAQAKTEHNDAVAESEYAKRQLAEEEAKARKKREMAAERASDSAILMKEKELRKKQFAKKAFPTKRPEQDVDAYEAEQRQHTRSMYRTMQEQQAKERAARERREAEEDRKLDEAMLTATQKQFYTKLATLQSLVPEEFGIKVPTYTLKTTFSK